jgi:toxin ParE1/3/4
VADYRLSKRADADVLEITSYTIKHFGNDQAQRYHNGLKHAFQLLAHNPARGRPADEVAPGLRRSSYQSHVVFFRTEPQGIVIVRVLHQRMDIPRHQMDE